jgi:hypothetical protein
MSSIDWKKYCNSASSFFDLMPEDVQALLNMATKDRDALAFWGDSFLNHACSTYLYSAVPAERHTKGCLTLTRQSLVCNEILSSLCKSFNDIPKSNLEQLNDHSVGTIFEALVESAKRKNGADFMQNRLDLMFGALMEKFTIPDELQVSMYVTEQTDMPQAASFTTDPLWQSYFKNVQNLLPYDRCKAAAADDERGLKNVTRYERSDSEHGDEIVEVLWRSKSKITYASHFYRCCGSDANRFSDTFVRRCPRYDWARPDSYHPGTLRPVQAGQSGGGVGPRGRSSDHIPVCGPVRWTCCYGSGSSEGCCVDEDEDEDEFEDEEDEDEDEFEDEEDEDEDEADPAIFIHEMLNGRSPEGYY